VPFDATCCIMALLRRIHTGSVIRIGAAAGHDIDLSPPAPPCRGVTAVSTWNSMTHRAMDSGSGVERGSCWLRRRAEEVAFGRLPPVTMAERCPGRQYSGLVPPSVAQNGVVGTVSIRSPASAISGSSCTDCRSTTSPRWHRWSSEHRRQRSPARLPSRQS